jgi:uncharacterized cupredoxin-like copper-binding protein
MAAFAVLAVAVGVTTSSVLASGNRVEKTTVKVSALDTLKFTLSKKSAPAGVVAFVVTNKGALQHDFAIAGKKTPLLSKGKTSTLVVTLKKGKSYPYMCTVPGHAAAGMKGVFKAT